MYYILKSSPKPIQYLKGVGPARAKAFEKEGITTDVELLYYFPRTYINRTSLISLKQVYARLLQDNYTIVDNNTYNFKEEVTILGKVIEKKIYSPSKTKKFLFVTIKDLNDSKAKINFWQYADYFAKQFNVGDYLIIRGIPELGRYNEITFNHPEIELFDSADQREFQNDVTLPVYSIPMHFHKAKINNKLLRSIISQTVDETNEKIEDYLPNDLLKELGYYELSYCLKNVHFPNNPNEIPQIIERFKFEEIFLFEILLALSRKQTNEQVASPRLKLLNGIVKDFSKSLSFELTDDQKKAIREIFRDMTSGGSMNRLLQGDVGSGKTIVAIYAMLLCLENGYQSLIMAPTEILAEQHYLTLLNLLEGFPVNIELVVGSQNSKQRELVANQIANGTTNIIVGTHALFEEKMKYNKLALVVIDEQHRFGVIQRAKLKEMGSRSLGNHEVPHVLVMSATPIPRTLAMTVYGDLDVSTIRQMPKGRKSVITQVVFESDNNRMFDFVRNEVKNGRQAYFVYPLIEKSEKMDLKAATEHFDVLQTKVFPEFNCALLHGQMRWYEKEEIMKKFKNKEFHILVATTVIEVGIDVPNATIMVIENAERFGLAQLHQLRGRVGRSELQSYCFLVTKDEFNTKLSREIFHHSNQKTVIARLKAMELTTNGFEIAEIDLKLRGPGDIIGTQQSGLPPFKYINLTTDGDIIVKARKFAMELLKDDPQLKSYLKLRQVVSQLREFKKYWGIA